MSVSDKACSNGSQENREIDRGLLKGFLRLRTVVPALGNMGRRLLPTVQILSDGVKGKRRDGVIEPNDPEKGGRQGPRA